MITPAVCPTCGNSVGDVSLIFLYIRAKRLKKELSKTRETPQSSFSNTAMDVDMTDLFPKLGMEGGESSSEAPKGCDYCRVTLATSMQWVDEH